MMDATATVTTGELDYEYDLLQGVFIYNSFTLQVTATVKQPYKEQMYSRPWTFKKGQWSYG